MNPMTFGAALRVITGRHDMMYERKMFQKYDISGNGTISPDDFHEVLKTESDPELVRGFMAYASGSMQNF